MAESPNLQIYRLRLQNRRNSGNDYINFDVVGAGKLPIREAIEKSEKEIGEDITGAAVGGLMKAGE